MLIERGDEGVVGVVQKVLEPAAQGDATGIRGGVEALRDVHVGLQRLHQVAQAHGGDVPGQGQPATFSFRAVDVVQLHQAVRDLD